MPPRERLRAVTPEDKPSARKKLTVAQAAREGSARDLWVAMRDRIAEAVSNPNTPARELAALTKRLAEVVREIDAIDASAGEGDVGSAAQTPDEALDSEAL